MIMNTRVMENVSFKVTNWPNNFNCKKIAPLTLPRKSVSTTTLQALCRIPKIPVFILNKCQHWTVYARDTLYY